MNSTNFNKILSKFSIFAFLTVTAITFCVISTAIVNSPQKLAFRDILTLFYFDGYSNYNKIGTEMIGGIDVSELIYLSFCISAIIILTRLSFKPHHLSWRSKINHSILAAAWSLCLIVISLQFMSHALLFQKARTIVKGQGYAQRLGPNFFKQVYYTFNIYKRYLPGRHKTLLITDLDWSKEPHMTTHRFLSYLLYPIDIRGVREEDYDSLIMIQKKNAADHLPPEYRAIKIFDSAHLIAVKNKEWK